MSDNVIAFPGRQQLEADPHDEMCLTPLSLLEGNTERHAATLCNCSYLREVRANQVRRDERAIRDRAARLEVDWAESWTEHRTAYVQGMYVAAETLRGIG